MPGSIGLPELLAIAFIAAILYAIFGRRTKTPKSADSGASTDLTIKIDGGRASAPTQSASLQWRKDSDPVPQREPSRFVIDPVLPHGFLAVVGESHYQDALNDAKEGWAQHEGPILMATLVPQPHNRYDPNAVAVLIEPFGLVGYLERDIAPRYASALQRAGIAAKCPAQLRGGIGEKTFIGVVLDSARLSEGDPLHHYERFFESDDDDPVDEHYAEYYRRREANQKFVFETRLLEASDPAGAAVRYGEALIAMREYEAIGVERGYIQANASRGDVTIIDRLTLCLIKSGREAEAVIEADRYFADFPDALNGTAGRTVKLRIEKRRAKVSGTGA